MRYVTLVQPEGYPDLLRQRTGEYLDADGFCFAPQVETSSDGAGVMAVYFQNRYGGEAAARVLVLPPRRAWRVARHDLAAQSFDVTCPGGAFGVVRAPLAIPAEYQGRRMTFTVAADVSYPGGRGELLRFRPGLRVGSIEELALFRRARRALSKLAAGQLPVAAPARAALTLPQGVRETDAPGAIDAGEAEMIWWPALLERDEWLRSRRAA